jgi:putative FmdB family regulatory protein
MPLYEYQCDACGNRFEVIQKFSDPPIEVCPKCGGAVKKLQSAPAFQFKGSGWYITDYARKDQAGPGKNDKNDKKDEKDKKSERTEGTASSTDKAAEPAKSETRTEKKTETSKSEGGSQKSDRPKSGE